MAIDNEFDIASEAHTERAKRGWGRFSGIETKKINLQIPVQDYVDLKAMSHADGKTIAESLVRLIARERTRRDRLNYARNAA